MIDREQSINPQILTNLTVKRLFLIISNPKILFHLQEFDLPVISV